MLEILEVKEPLREDFSDINSFLTAKLRSIRQAKKYLAKKDYVTIIVLRRESGRWDLPLSKLLIAEAKKGNIPAIHVNMHGSSKYYYDRKEALAFLEKY